MKRSTFWMGTAVLLFIGCALRFHALGADPSQGIGWVFLSDEGWWAHNARNHYLFGSWILDDWNQGIFLAPLHTFLVRISFELFGLGLIQARAVSAAAGIVTIALVGVILARSAGNRAAMWGVGILAIDTFSISYSRVALVDALPLTLMTVAVALAGPARRYRVPLDVAAGAVAMAAVLAKFNAIVFLPMLVVGVVGYNLATPDPETGHRIAAAVRRGASVLIGIAAVALVWFFGLVLPNLDGWQFELGRVADENVSPRGLYLLFKGFAFGLHASGERGIELGGLLRDGLLPVSLCMVWALQCGVRAIREGVLSVVRNWTYAEFLSAVWLALEVGSLWFTSAPDRRHLWMIVPCAILGAHALGHLSISDLRLSESAIATREHWRARAIGIVFVCVLGVYLRVPIAAVLLPLTEDIQVGFSAGLSLGTICSIALVILCGVGATIGPACVRLMHRTELRWGSVAIGIALLAGSITVVRIGVESMNRTYELRRVSQEIQEFIGDEAAVAGAAVTTLLLENSNRALVIHDRTEIGWGVYGLDYLDEVNPRYIILEAANDREPIEKATRRFTHDWGGANPVSSHFFRFAETDDRTVNFRVVQVANN